MNYFSNCGHLDEEIHYNCQLICDICSYEATDQNGFIVCPGPCKNFHMCQRCAN